MQAPDFRFLVVLQDEPLTNLMPAAPNKNRKSQAKLLEAAVPVQVAPTSPEKALEART